MKQLVLNIPDDKAQVFIEFIKTIDYIEILDISESSSTLADVQKEATHKALKTPQEGNNKK